MAVYVRLNFGEQKVQELLVRELADEVIGYVVYLLGGSNAASHFCLETTWKTCLPGKASEFAHVRKANRSLVGNIIIDVTIDWRSSHQLDFDAHGACLGDVKQWGRFNQHHILTTNPPLAAHYSPVYLLF